MLQLIIFTLLFVAAIRALKIMSNNPFFKTLFGVIVMTFDSVTAALRIVLNVLTTFFTILFGAFFAAVEKEKKHRNNVRESKEGL